jgi:hypothetical protein
MDGTQYRITVRGRLGSRFATAFDGMALEPGQGETVLVGEITDSAQLYGLMDRLRDFGLELVSVIPVGR